MRKHCQATQLPLTLSVYSFLPESLRPDHSSPPASHYHMGASLPPLTASSFPCCLPGKGVSHQPCLTSNVPLALLLPFSLLFTVSLESSKDRPRPDHMSSFFLPSLPNNTYTCTAFVLFPVLCHTGPSCGVIQLPFPFFGRWTCGVRVWGKAVCGSQGRTVGVLPYPSLPYCPETGSLSEPRAASKPHRFSCLHGADRRGCAGALLHTLLSHLSRPIFFSFCFMKQNLAQVEL